MFEVGTIFWSRYLLVNACCLKSEEQRNSSAMWSFQLYFYWVRVFAGGSETVEVAFNTGFKMNPIVYCIQHWR